MAADEVLLHSVRADVALLRFYQWLGPTVSLGYFQQARIRTRWPELPFVRRPTGGATLVHHHELTYCLALVTQLSPALVLRAIHEIIAETLCSAGIPAMLAETVQRDDTPLCFRHIVEEDVVCNGVKIAGSAQRKQRQHLLQHGAILLERSEYTPELPGLLEADGPPPPVDRLRTEITSVLGKILQWRMETRDWSQDERHAIRRLTDQKYSQTWWNEKR